MATPKKKPYDWLEQPQQPAPYTPGQSVQDAYNAYQGVAGQKPADYVSQYQGQMNEMFNKISNRKPFSYDVNADALYQQYKDQYQRMGKMAMKDTMGQAQAMTGGYGNTYAQTAGNQAYQGYLQRLNEMVPQLEQRAYDRYQGEGQDLYNQYGLAAQAEAMDYGKHQDAYNRWMQEQQLAYNQYADERGFDYGAYQDALQQQNWQQQFDYGQQRDAVADSQWQQGFDYGKLMDEQQQANWMEQFDYGKLMDQQQQQNWQSQFDYGAEKDAQDKVYSQAMALLQGGQMPSAEALQAAGISGDIAQQLAKLYTPQPVTTSGGKKNKGDEFKLKFKPDQIAAALEAKKTGGEEGLDRYVAGLEGQGYSAQELLWMYNYADTNMKQEKKNAFGESILNSLGNFAGSYVDALKKTLGF